MADKPHYTAQQFLEAIPGTGGIVTAIAKKIGCTWTTAKRYIDNHPTIQQAYNDECESVLDLAEAKTIQLIQAGDAQMIRYYLSTKGKRRGYVERQELAGADGGPVRLVWDDGTDVTTFASGPTDGLG